MRQGHLNAVVRHLRQLAGDVEVECTDGELLQRFVASRDEKAFTALVRRHGGLIRTVCRHILHRKEDVEDALQASLLVLAQRAASIRKADSVASWLYGVAYRTAMNAKKTAARRQQRERQAPSRSPEQPVSEAALRELQAILDEEVQRLPQKYRAVFVLCCLEGKGKAEAARELGWKEGTVSGRLTQARKRLQERLIRRGITLSAALCATTVCQDTTTAAVPGAVIQAVLSFTPGKTGAVSAPAVALAEGILKAMFATKLKLGVVLLLTLGVLAGGVGLAAHHAFLTKQSEVNKPKRPQTAEGTKQPRPDVEEAAPKDRYGDPLPQEAISRLGTVRLRHGGFTTLVRFTPDGKTVVSHGGDGVRSWDVGTGKQIHFLPSETMGRSFRGAVSFSADRKQVLAANEAGIHLWDLATAAGAKLRQIGPMGEVGFVTTDGWGPAYVATLSPGGKWLAYGRREYLTLYNMATGRETHRLTGLSDGATALTFSRDSRMLAWVDESKIHLLEVASGKERHVLIGHRGSVLSLCFSLDGKTVVSGSSDSTALVWDLTGRLGDERTWGKPLSRVALDACWAGLADEDAARAYRAIRRLASTPDQAISYLRGRLHPVEPVDEKHLESLIADLDSPQFSVREKATKTLESFGDRATAACRRALEEQPRLETRRRLETVLEKQSQAWKSPAMETLRALRALEVLELANTQQARQTLQRLASGTPEARLTQEAKASLERLAKRPAVP